MLYLGPGPNKCQCWLGGGAEATRNRLKMCTGFLCSKKQLSHFIKLCDV